MALEAVQRIDALFEIERSINGHDAEARTPAVRSMSAPLVADLETWMREERAKLSRHNDVAKAMDYMLKRWTAFTRFLDDGRICLSNNAAERALRGIALGRKSWLFAGSDRGGERAAVMYSLIVTAKMNDIDPQAWLADVLARIADHPAHRLDELLPWNWQPATAAVSRGGLNTASAALTECLPCTRISMPFSRASLSFSFAMRQNNGAKGNRRNLHFLFVLVEAQRAHQLIELLGQAGRWRVRLSLDASFSKSWATRLPSHS